MEPGALAIGEHVGRDGRVYRVVGVRDGSVTLLRVTDGDGRRRSTGEVRTVSAEELAGFERAGDPDAGVRPIRWLLNLASGTVWACRLAIRWVTGRR